MLSAEAAMQEQCRGVGSCREDVQRPADASVSRVQ